MRITTATQPISPAAMTPTQKPRRRPPVKRRQIVRTLRDEIVSGRLSPGDRLPTRVDLAHRFHTGSVTVQQAVESLISDGFLVAQDRQGTFVSETPPHLYQIAMCFPYRASDPRWVRFWTAMINEADRLESRTRWRFRKYFDVNANPCTESYDELLADIRSGCLMGAMFPHYPLQLVGTDVLKQPGFPRVGIHSPGQVDFGTVNLDGNSLVDRSLEHLQERGCRRIAVVMKHDSVGQNLELILQACQARGLEVPSYWAQTLPVAPPLAAARVAHLLFQPNQAERPDGIFITDDNLSDAVTAGMVDAGVRATDGVEIVAHSNFPWSTPSHLPARRIGYDIARLVLMFTELLAAKQRGEETPAMTLQAQFEDEIALDAQEPVPGAS